jgi:hypothetical protein
VIHLLDRKTEVRAVQYLGFDTNQRLTPIYPAPPSFVSRRLEILCGSPPVDNLICRIHFVTGAGQEHTPLSAWP